jgi:hypothetical protein
VLDGRAMVVRSGAKSGVLLIASAAGAVQTQARLCRAA